MYGTFSPEAIEAFTEAVGEENFSEGLFDFTTCERSDGSLYGTSGHCRKGTQTDSRAKAAARAKAKFNKEEMESPKNKADMDHAGLRKLMANSPTAQRQLREAAAAKAEGKAKATPKGLTATEAASRLANKYEDVMKKVTGTTNPERLEKIKKIAKEMADETVNRAKDLGVLGNAAGKPSPNLPLKEAGEAFRKALRGESQAGK